MVAQVVERCTADLNKLGSNPTDRRLYRCLTTANPSAPLLIELWQNFELCQGLFCLKFKFLVAVLGSGPSTAFGAIEQILA